MITLQDIADITGVSKMTVSNVLNGRPNVGATTRERVLSTVRRLDYHPNLAASALSSGRSGFVEIVIQDFDSPFYGKLAQILTKRVDSNGMQSIVCQALYSVDAERRIMTMDMSSRLFCDALILVTHDIGLDEARHLAQGRALILVDEISQQEEFCTVNTPNYEGAKAAMTHLLDRGVAHPYIFGAGRDEIVHSNGKTKPDPVGRLRLEGIRDALLEHGRQLTQDMCIAMDWVYAQAREKARILAESQAACDGILAMSDQVALGVVRGLADAGIRVPEDVKVIGFDGVTVDGYTVPSLSTVEIDMRSMADIIVDRLQALMRSPESSSTPCTAPVTHDVADFVLRARESTGGPNPIGIAS